MQPRLGERLDRIRLGLPRGSDSSLSVLSKGEYTAVCPLCLRLSPSHPSPPNAGKSKSTDNARPSWRRLWLHPLQRPSTASRRPGSKPPSLKPRTQSLTSNSSRQRPTASPSTRPSVLSSSARPSAASRRGPPTSPTAALPRASPRSDVAWATNSTGWSTGGRGRWTA